MSVYSNWKYFFDSFWKFVSRNSYPIVLVLFFIWICHYCPVKVDK